MISRFSNHPSHSLKIIQKPSIGARSTSANKLRINVILLSIKARHHKVLVDNHHNCDQYTIQLQHDEQQHGF